MNRIAVIGLGQIGGSLVLALRKARPSLHITGVDVVPRRLRLLRGKLDVASRDWRATGDADLTIVCLHFHQTMEYLSHCPRERLILDVCSGKRKVVALANRRRIRFVGGHPMAGNERAGEKGWDPELFRGRPFFLCPGRHARRGDIASVKKLIASLNARSVVVEPADHDRWMALSSHLPALLSVAFRRFTRSVPPVFQGPGYQSMTRLSRTSPELLESFIASNGDLIARTWKRWLACERRESAG